MRGGRRGESEEVPEGSFLRDRNRAYAFVALLLVVLMAGGYFVYWMYGVLKGSQIQSFYQQADEFEKP